MSSPFHNDFVELYQPAAFVSPGEVLEEYLTNGNWKRKEFSVATGLSLKEIRDLISGKMKFNEVIGRTLGLIFSRPPHFWINLQQQHDDAKTIAATKERGNFVAMYDSDANIKDFTVIVDGNFSADELSAIARQAERMGR